MAELPGLPSWAQGWLDSYVAKAGPGDVLRGDYGRGAKWWHRLFEGIAGLTGGRFDQLQDRAARQVRELGMAFRLPGEGQERGWPISAMPLLIGADEWTNISTGIVQRAELLEAALDDLYGAQALVAEGAIPAAVVTGSKRFARQMIGVAPPGGHRLHIYAVDLGRGPDGDWRVLADHVRAPTGAGYALENRLASSRVMGQLLTDLNVHRHAPFFAAFREGLAAVGRRSEPRIGLLTPGRFNQSYAEQAHLARYLGLLLVEGDDLAVHDDKVFVRTIEGLKRVDVLWRRMDSRFLDPLAFDAQSQIGVPELIDAMAAGNVVVANMPGSGMIEVPAMAAFLPALSRRLLGRPLLLPNIATWWCGQDAVRRDVEAQLDTLLIGPAFADPVRELGSAAVRGSTIRGAVRDRLFAAMRDRPIDYVGQEVVRLSTMPTTINGTLVPRPFILRAFAARDANGKWVVMPGGFARLGEAADPRASEMGEGAFSADVCVLGLEKVEPVSLLPQDVPIRRNPGTLPSRAADNLYWLGRYLERAEGTLRLIRAALGGTIDSSGGASLTAETLDRLNALLLSTGASADTKPGNRSDIRALVKAALDGSGVASVRTLLSNARAIAAGTRERLSPDVWRLVDAPLPEVGEGDSAQLLDRATALQERLSALSGLAAENMGRTAGWRFHDLGRRVERAILGCRLLRNFAQDAASRDDLTTLLDLVDSQISYRQRYLQGMALVPVRDLVALDPYNPRSVAYQVEVIRGHLAALPNLRDDGMDEEQEVVATEIGAAIMLARAETLDTAAVLAIENRLLALSEAVSRRFFLQGSETIRASSIRIG